MKIIIKNPTLNQKGFIIDGVGAISNDGPNGATDFNGDGRATIGLASDMDMTGKVGVKTLPLNVEGQIVVEVDGELVPFYFDEAGLLDYFGEDNKSGTGIVFTLDTTPSGSKRLSVRLTNAGTSNGAFVRHSVREDNTLMVEVYDTGANTPAWVEQPNAFPSTVISETTSFESDVYGTKSEFLRVRVGNLVGQTWQFIDRYNFVDRSASPVILRPLDIPSSEHLQPVFKMQDDLVGHMLVSDYAVPKMTMHRLSRANTNSDLAITETLDTGYAYGSLSFSFAPIANAILIMNGSQPEETSLVVREFNSLDLTLGDSYTVTGPLLNLATPGEIINMDNADMVWVSDYLAVLNINSKLYYINLNYGNKTATTGLLIDSYMQQVINLDWLNAPMARIFVTDSRNADATYKVYEIDTVNITATLIKDSTPFVQSVLIDEFLYPVSGKNGMISFQQFDEQGGLLSVTKNFTVDAAGDLTPYNI